MGNEANGILSQQNLLALTTDVGSALTCCDDLNESLQLCTEAIVKHLGAAFARIWVLDQSSNTLILKASSGMYTNLDGAHSQMKLGERKIGRIALERKAQITNEVLTDSLIGDKDWARDNNMVAFAGYPLVIQDQVVGVIGMFAQHRLSEDVLRAFDAISDGIAVGVHRNQIEQLLTEREHVFLQFANNIKDVLFIVRPHATRVMWVSRSVEEIFGYPLEDHYTNPMLIMQCVVPEDKARVAAFMEETEIFNADAADKRNDIEYRITRKDGQVRWLWTRIFPTFGIDGKVSQLCGFTHDITERKEGERRVSEFYSTVSHELRTPLTSIRAALGLIEGGVTDPSSAESLELIGIARREADRLIRLINDILDMRKMEAGKLPMTLQNLEPAQIVNHTIASMRSFAQEKDVKLVSQIADEQPFVGDRDRVVQVLTNLLSNAIKFSPHGATVKVSVKAGFSGRLRFAVVDEGPGIPVEDQSKLFGVFQQLDSSDTREVGGTGLGLAISKAIVEKLGGAIGFISVLGEGSTFWFDLPLAGASPLYPDGTGIAPDVAARNTPLRNFVEEYAAILPNRLASLKSRLMDARDSQEKQSLTDCLNEVRKIRASAEPCGFLDVARIMVQIEQLLEYLEVGQGNAETLWAQIESFLISLDRAL